MVSHAYSCFYSSLSVIIILPILHGHSSTQATAFGTLCTLTAYSHSHLISSLGSNTFLRKMKRQVQGNALYFNKFISIAFRATSYTSSSDIPRSTAMRRHSSYSGD